MILGCFDPNNNSGIKKNSHLVILAKRSIFVRDCNFCTCQVRLFDAIMFDWCHAFTHIPGQHWSGVYCSSPRLVAQNIIHLLVGFMNMDLDINYGLPMRASRLNRRSWFISQALSGAQSLPMSWSIWPWKGIHINKLEIDWQFNVAVSKIRVGTAWVMCVCVCVLVFDRTAVWGVIVCN